MRWLWLLLPAFTLFHIPSETWFQNYVRVDRVHLDTSEIALVAFGLTCLFVASSSKLRAVWATGMAFPWLLYIGALLLSTWFAADKQLAFIEDVQVIAGVALALTIWLTINSAVQLRTVLSIIAVAGVGIAIALIAIAAYSINTAAHTCPDNGLCLGGSMNIRALLIDGRLYPRANIPGVDYNRSGLELVLATLTALYLSRTSAGRVRALWTAAAVILFAGVVSTFSKGALGSFGIAALITLALGWWRWGTVAATAGLELVALVATGYLVPFLTRAVEIFSFVPSVNHALIKEGTLDTSDRVAMAQSTTTFINQQPITGIGPLNLQGRETVHRLATAEHNDYLRALVETGVIGFAALVFVVVVPVVLLSAALAGVRQMETRDRLMGQLLLAGLGALIINFVVAPIDYSFWVWVGLIGAWLTLFTPGVRLGSLAAQAALRMVRLPRRSSPSVARSVSSSGQ